MRKKRKAKQAQSGRSLVEMLGVLAVIGILSGAGLFAYSEAMKRHKANEMFIELEFRANRVATQILINSRPEDIPLSDMAFLRSGRFTFEAITVNSNQFKVIAIGKVEDEICRHMYSMIGSNTVVRAMGSRNSNYTSPADCDGQKDKPELAFLFNNDMSKGN